jgi:hypothetical protein
MAFLGAVKCCARAFGVAAAWLLLAVTAQWSARAETDEPTPNFVGLRPQFGLGSTVGDAVGLTLQIGYLSANVEQLKFAEEAAALTTFGVQLDVRGSDLLFAVEGGSAAAQFLEGDSESVGDNITADLETSDNNAMRRGPYGALQVGLCSHGGEVTSDLFLRYEFQSLAGGGSTRKFDAIVVGAAVTFRSKMKGILDSVVGG